MPRARATAAKKAAPKRAPKKVAKKAPAKKAAKKAAPKKAAKKAAKKAPAKRAAKKWSASPAAFNRNLTVCAWTACTFTKVQITIHLSSLPLHFHPSPFLNLSLHLPHLLSLKLYPAYQLCRLNLPTLCATSPHPFHSAFCSNASCITFALFSFRQWLLCVCVFTWVWFLSERQDTETLMWWKHLIGHLIKIFARYKPDWCTKTHTTHVTKLC